MKILHSITAISMLAAVSFPVVAESVEKSISSSESNIYTILLSMDLDQKLSVQRRQECILHLEEKEQWLVQMDDLLLRNGLHLTEFSTPLGAEGIKK